MTTCEQELQWIKEDVLAPLLADFEWLLQKHPEHNGEHALSRIEKAEKALA